MATKIRDENRSVRKQLASHRLALRLEERRQLRRDNSNSFAEGYMKEECIDGSRRNSIEHHDNLTAGDDNLTVCVSAASFEDVVVEKDVLSKSLCDGCAVAINPLSLIRPLPPDPPHSQEEMKEKMELAISPPDPTVPEISMLNISGVDNSGHIAVHGSSSGAIEVTKETVVTNEVNVTDIDIIELRGDIETVCQNITDIISRIDLTVSYNLLWLEDRSYLLRHDYNEILPFVSEAFLGHVLSLPSQFSLTQRRDEDRCSCDFVSSSSDSCGGNVFDVENFGHMATELRRKVDILSCVTELLLQSSVSHAGSSPIPEIGITEAQYIFLCNNMSRSESKTNS